MASYLLFPTPLLTSAGGLPLTYIGCKQLSLSSAALLPYLPPVSTAQLVTARCILHLQSPLHPYCPCSKFSAVPMSWKQSSFLPLGHKRELPQHSLVMQPRPPAVLTGWGGTECPLIGTFCTHTHTYITHVHVHAQETGFYMHGTPPMYESPQPLMDAFGDKHRRVLNGEGKDLASGQL